jgi:hypothetical protein
MGSFFLNSSSFCFLLFVGFHLEENEEARWHAYKDGFQGFFSPSNMSYHRSNNMNLVPLKANQGRQQKRGVARARRSEQQQVTGSLTSSLVPASDERCMR